MDFDDTPEQKALREAVAALGRRYGHEYFVAKAKSGGHQTELWAEAGKLGYLGANLPAEYGGAGGGITELAIVAEELAAAGCPLLLIVVSPAIAGTVIARHGTEQQRRHVLPGIADGSTKVAFAITEPEAGSNFHRLGTVARRDGDDWLLRGSKAFISGIDECDLVLVVARTEDAATGKLKPALFLVPTDAPGLSRTPLEMEVVAPEKQWLLYLDDVRVPATALVGGSTDAGLPALFAGLNPERITIAASAVGTGRYALERAAEHAEAAGVERAAEREPHLGVAVPAEVEHRALGREEVERALEPGRRRARVHDQVASTRRLFRPGEADAERGRDLGA